MLTRIQIRGYKSLRDVEVKLPELALLFGPNAAGKSNFLDCLQLLSKLATARTIKEAFDPPYRGKPLESFSFGTDAIRGALAQERLSFSIEADVRLSDAVIDALNRQIREMRRSGAQDVEPDEEAKAAAIIRERNLRYRIDVEMLPRSGILRVAEEYLGAITEKGQPSERRKPFLSREENRLHLRLEGQAHPSYFERFLDHSILSLPHYPPHYPHLVAIRKEFENWLFFYFEPRERMRAVNPVKEVRHIGLMGEELASFLNTLKALDPRQFESVEKSLRTIMPSIQGIGIEVSNLGEVELSLYEDGIAVPARVLSEGTLRILGLLALAGAKEKPSLIGFEEPENGVHPGRIRLIADLLMNRAGLGDTQYIVTTHSPLLADLVPETSLFACRKVSGQTRIEPLASWGAIAKGAAIEDALWGAIAKGAAIEDALRDDEDLTVGDRMIRGDFDA